MLGGLEGRVETTSTDRFRSEGERRVAATLDRYGIPFVYEQSVTVNDNGKTRTLRPDFYLPHLGVYIEYYGRAGDADYDLRTSRKEAAYAANGIRVLPVYPWDLCQDWPGSLLNYLERMASERQPSRDGGAPRATPGYHSPAHAPSYAGPSRRRYR